MRHSIRLLVVVLIAAFTTPAVARAETSCVRAYLTRFASLNSQPPGEVFARLSPLFQLS